MYHCDIPRFKSVDWGPSILSAQQLTNLPASLWELHRTWPYAKDWSFFLQRTLGYDQELQRQKEMLWWQESKKIKSVLIRRDIFKTHVTKFDIECTNKSHSYSYGDHSGTQARTEIYGWHRTAINRVWSGYEHELVSNFKITDFKKQRGN